MFTCNKDRVRVKLNEPYVVKSVVIDGWSAKQEGGRRFFFSTNDSLIALNWKLSVFNGGQIRGFSVPLIEPISNHNHNQGDVLKEPFVNGRFRPTKVSIIKHKSGTCQRKNYHLG